MRLSEKLGTRNKLFCSKEVVKCILKHIWYVFILKHWLHIKCLQNIGQTKCKVWNPALSMLSRISMQNKKNVKLKHMFVSFKFFIWQPKNQIPIDKIRPFTFQSLNGLS